MFRFLWAKLTRNEAALAQYSCTLSDVLCLLSGKSVAIVGNARALSRCDQGALIDAADIVVRINGAPMPSPISHGERTDWMAVSMSPPRHIMAKRSPDLTLWMSHKRHRLAWWLVQSGPFFLRSNEDSDRLGNRPTTGLMIIDLVARSKAAGIHLHGFDFFASQSLSGSRTADQVPHDFRSEQAYIDALIAADPRIKLHPMD